MSSGIQQKRLPQRSATASSPFFLPSGLLIAQTVFLIECLDTSTSRNSLLLSGVERMALGTYLDVDLLLCGAYDESISTVAGNRSLIILRMNSFLHDFHLFLLFLVEWNTVSQHMIHAHLIDSFFSIAQRLSLFKKNQRKFANRKIC